MKLVSSNGKELTVRDLGPERMKLVPSPGAPPIKVNGDFIMDDEAAREKVRAIVATGFYEYEKRGGEAMPAGKIWAEYWIDCAGPCGDHAPLAETEIGKAIARAKEDGWEQIGDRWYCRKCASTVKERAA